MFTSQVTWRWCFYINLPLGAVALGAGVYFLPSDILDRSKDADRLKGLTRWQIIQKFDPIGTVILIPSLVCILLALQWGGQKYSWSDGRVIALLVVFGVTIIAWSALQYCEGEDATVPIQVIKQRSVAFAALYTLFSSGAFTILVYYLPIWYAFQSQLPGFLLRLMLCYLNRFQAIKNDTPEESGLHILPSVLSLTAFALTAGGLVNKFGYYVPWLILGSILTSIGAGLVSTLNPNSSIGEW